MTTKRRDLTEKSSVSMKTRRITSIEKALFKLSRVKSLLKEMRMKTGSSITQYNSKRLTQMKEIMTISYRKAPRSRLIRGLLPKIKFNCLWKNKS